ncbi:unnamed protein product [Rangifer tarandus platyrhynchus]|uniref:Uncharacterized protein n=2 Tax=Rangifer tarandus platyrhynchus TaxID=3082113 RepID=A0AC59ZRZ2_RANTA|nr:unnamed protein product [Rangifer tarandus platyrhynchus]
MLQPRPEGPPAPPSLSFKNKPGSCLVSLYPRPQLSEGTPPTARPGPVCTRVRHHRHTRLARVTADTSAHVRASSDTLGSRACVTTDVRTQARACVRHHGHSTALAGLLRPWGPRALLGPDTHLSEHPYICIHPCDLPAAEKDSSGTEKGQTSPPPPAGTVGSSGLGPQPRGPLKPVPLLHSRPGPARPPHPSCDLRGGDQLASLTFSPRHCLLCLEHPSAHPSPLWPSVLRSDSRLGSPLGNAQSFWGLPHHDPTPPGPDPLSPHPSDPRQKARGQQGQVPLSARRRAGNALSPWEPPSPEDMPLARGHPPLSSLPEEFLWGPFHLQITPVCTVSCPEVTL